MVYAASKIDSFIEIGKQKNEILKSFIDQESDFFTLLNILLAHYVHLFQSYYIHITFAAVWLYYQYIPAKYYPLYTKLDSI